MFNVTTCIHIIVVVKLDKCIEQSFTNSDIYTAIHWELLSICVIEIRARMFLSTMINNSQVLPYVNAKWNNKHYANLL